MAEHVDKRLLNDNAEDPLQPSPHAQPQKPWKKNPRYTTHTQRKSISNPRLKNKCEIEAELEAELERLKRRIGMGFEVKVKWLPDTTKFKNGRQLLEEVAGDRILIYAEDPAEAMQLLHHGFAEWLLNQHTKRYRLFINKLIEVFEQIQYEEKEKIIEAIARLMAQLK